MQVYYNHIDSFCLVKVFCKTFARVAWIGVSLHYINQQSFFTLTLSPWSLNWVNKMRNKIVLVTLLLTAMLTGGTQAQAQVQIELDGTVTICSWNRVRLVKYVKTKIIVPNRPVKERIVDTPVYYYTSVRKCQTFAKGKVPYYILKNIPKNTKGYEYL